MFYGTTDFVAVINISCASACVIAVIIGHERGGSIGFATKRNRWCLLADIEGYLEAVHFLTFDVGHILRIAGFSLAADAHGWVFWLVSLATDTKQ